MPSLGRERALERRVDERAALGEVGLEVHSPSDLERPRPQLPVAVARQDLDALLDRAEALVQRLHQPDAALEGGERVLERELAGLELG